MLSTVETGENDNAAQSAESLTMFDWFVIGAIVAVLCAITVVGVRALSDPTTDENAAAALVVGAYPDAVNIIYNNKLGTVTFNVDGQQCTADVDATFESFLAIPTCTPE